MPRDHHAQYMRSPQFRVATEKKPKKWTGHEFEKKIFKMFRKLKFWKN
jgi:hypothetical protein